MAEGNAGPGTMQDYVRLKGRLMGCIDRMAAMERVSGYPCMELREKVEADVFNLVVVGQFKRGKTCFINALLGKSILPVAVVPLTSIVTVLRYGERLTVTVYFNDGREEAIDCESLSEYVTEIGNPNNMKEVREVVITYPSPYLKDGVRLIDTPGVGSVYQHNTDVAYKYLPQSDAALFLLSVDQPVSRAELDFLTDVRQYSDRIFFLLNKIDYVSESEVEQSIRFSQKALEEVMGAGGKIFPVSARLALSAKTGGSEDDLRGSRLPAFSEVLSRFLLHEKGKVLLLSVSNNLLRILAQVEFETELELKSLSTPLEEIREKVAAFEDKKREIVQERKNFDLLLNGEVDRIVRLILDEDLAAFKRELTERMEQGFDDFCESHADLTLKELNDALESFVTEEVEQSFNMWRAAEDNRVSGAFDEACNRFVAGMNDTVDTLLSFSSQLFDVRFEAVKAESVWTTESGLYLKLREDPVGLDLLASSVRCFRTTSATGSRSSRPTSSAWPTASSSTSEDAT
ncbi:MAG: dynamin family protein [Acidobacteriota bacterium]